MDGSGGGTRVERDTLGEMTVPADALYGAQTARAVENFPISGWRMPARFVRTLASIKVAFAEVNAELGHVEPPLAAAIADAAREVVAGRHGEAFPIDVFQTGSGTSTNMNVNEVVAHLANLRLGGDPAAHRPVHPNDHVNRGQSSNDVVPTALRLATASAWRDEVRPAIEGVAGELRRLAARHAATVTLGRTHLMDAVPTTYGRVFAAWAERLDEAAGRGDDVAAELVVVPLGGTAVGSGIGADPDAIERVAQRLAAATGLAVRAAASPAVGIQAQDTAIAMADALAGVGRVLLAIADDVRLRASGPFGGLGELRPPAVQPGSSIMPGKVNPVIPEAVAQVAFEVEGLAAASRATASLHQLDLSHANPLLAWNLDTMARLLAGACNTFAARCLAGLEVDEQRSRTNAEASPAMATALAQRLGYERAAEIAKEAERSGESVAATARRLGVLDADELSSLLDVERIAAVKRG
jgi:fumarate hydratase, class II